VAGDALGFAIKAQVFAPDGTRVGKEILSTWKRNLARDDEAFARCESDIQRGISR